MYALSICSLEISPCEGTYKTIYKYFNIQEKFASKCGPFMNSQYGFYHRKSNRLEELVLLYLSIDGNTSELLPFHGDETRARADQLKDCVKLIKVLSAIQ